MGKGGRYDDGRVSRAWAKPAERGVGNGEGRWFGTGTDDEEQDVVDEDGCYEDDRLHVERTMLKLIPFFDTATASTESARDFWWCFETATDGFDDPTRLRMFGARMDGGVAQRWWLNSRLGDFEMLKRRFYNRFIRLTEEQLLQRLFDAVQERDEPVDEWGLRVVRYCDEAQWFNETMRYTVFKNGLWSERVRRCLGCLPVQSIEVACAWVVAKELHRPVHEGYCVERQVQGRVLGTSGYGDNSVVGNAHGAAAQVHSRVELQKPTQSKTGRSLGDLPGQGRAVHNWTVEKDGEAEIDDGQDFSAGYCESYWHGQAPAGYGADADAGYGELDQCGREQVGHGWAEDDTEYEAHWNGEEGESTGQVEAGIEWEAQGVAEALVAASGNGEVLGQHGGRAAEDASDADEYEVKAEYGEAVVFGSVVPLPEVQSGTVAECLVAVKVMSADVVVPVARSVESRAVSCQDNEVGAVSEAHVRTVTLAREEGRFGDAVKSFLDQDAEGVGDIRTVVDGDDTVVTVVSCEDGQLRGEDNKKWATVSFVPLGNKTVICGDYGVIAGRRSGLVYGYELENRSSKDGCVLADVIPVVESWCKV